MKKIKISACILLISLIANSTLGQVKISTRGISVYQSISAEYIHVNTNSTVFYSGEQILYQLYCLNKKNEAGISKIAYVEIVNSNLETIHKERVRLDKAVGFGDFRIPFSIPSGNYKFIAYTQWMRNGGKQNFFNSDIYIINPFLNDFSNVLKANTTPTKENQVQNTNSKSIQLKLNKTSFKKREKVSLNLNSIKNSLGFGNYSISVKKSTDKKYSNHIKSLTHSNYEFVKNSNHYLVYPPEHKGELITGQVINSKSNKPVSNIRVALSIPSKTFELKFSKTNKLGEFYFDLENNYSGNTGIIQIEDDKKEKYKILLSNDARFDYSGLTFKKLALEEDQLNEIITRAKNIQIETSYSEIKEDVILAGKSIPTFYKPDYTYILNDYKRFPSVQETMVEIIDHAWVTVKRKKPQFFVRDYMSTGKEDKAPLILIDGILIQNQQDLFDFDVKKIHSINIITDKFLVENKTYGGVISVFTNKINFSPISKGEYLKEISLFKSSLNKKYFFQDYSKANNKRIPDYRTQLFWLPNFNFVKNNNELSFFTSDYEGNYEIKVEGFTYNGEKIVLRNFIEVK